MIIYSCEGEIIENININKLREIIIEELIDYDGEEPIKLPIDSELLNKLIFDNKKLCEALNDVITKIDLSNTICSDVEFIGTFENVNTTKTDFDGCYNIESISFEDKFKKKLRKLVKGQ